jgi:glycosyltransferase involved in cell wall biosynthesis
MSRPLVSIVINNFNYAEFVGQAIDSALHQTYAPIEVIVVDDGSTDESRSIIARYGSRVLPIWKENGGQASAFNAGVSSSRGDIISFLDSDDFFHPEKVQEVVCNFAGAQDPAKPILASHWLELVDGEGRVKTGRLGGMGKSPLNLYGYAKRYKFTYSPCGPTTAISLNRALANKIFPLPTNGLNVGADDLVRRAAALIGECYSIDKVLGSYRVHGDNRWYGTSDERTGTFEHINNLQSYLNQILVDNNLEPVISFWHSMYSCVYLADNSRWGALPRKMLTALAQHPDLHTLRFMYLLASSVIRRNLRARRNWTPAP